MVNLIEIHEACKHDDVLLRKLREWGLILNDFELKCPKCGNGMKVGNDKASPEGKIWFCGALMRKYEKVKAVKCTATIRLRKGTFFAQTKLTMFQTLGFAHFWSRGLSLVNIAHEVNISMKSAVDWASFCREVVLDAYLDKPQQLGGHGCTVEIDESKFGKRKYHRGHRVEGAWVFGGVERESGKVFMEVVEKRDSATLIPLIRKWIKPGTTIISDCWKAYKNLDEFNHLTVNHSVSFVDPVTAAHTNRIECIWRHGKESIGSHNRKKANLPGNLARYVFMKSVRVKKGDFGEEFFRLAGKLYDPRKLLEGGIEVDDEADDDNIFDDEEIDYFDE